MAKKLFDTQDPYAQAIASLVKKTLLVIGVFILLIIGGIGYFVIKSSSKVTSTPAVKQTAAVVTETAPSAQVLAAQVQESTQSPSPTPRATNIPSPTPSPSPSPTQTPTPTPTPAITPSPSPTVSPVLERVTITATPGLDGYIDQNGVVNTTSELRVGSTENTYIRSFISFNIEQIDVTKIKKAEVKLYQKGGKNTFLSGVDIRGDLVNYGSSLDPGDYGISSINPSFILVTNTGNDGMRQIDITDSIIRTKNEGRSTLQIRLHLSDENGYKNTYTSFESAENSLQSGNPPQLIVDTTVNSQ